MITQRMQARSLQLQVACESKTPTPLSQLQSPGIVPEDELPAMRSGVKVAPAISQFRESCWHVTA